MRDLGPNTDLGEDSGDWAFNLLPVTGWRGILEATAHSSPWTEIPEQHTRPGGCSPRLAAVNLRRRLPGSPPPSLFRVVKVPLRHDSQRAPLLMQFLQLGTDCRAQVFFEPAKAETEGEEMETGRDATTGAPEADLYVPRISLHLQLHTEIPRHWSTFPQTGNPQERWWNKPKTGHSNEKHNHKVPTQHRKLDPTFGNNPRGKGMRVEKSRYNRHGTHNWITLLYTRKQRSYTSAVLPFLNTCDGASAYTRKDLETVRQSEVSQRKRNAIY